MISGNLFYYESKSKRKLRYKRLMYVTVTFLGLKTWTKSACQWWLPYVSYFDWLKHMQMRLLIYRLIIYSYAGLPCICTCVCIYTFVFVCVPIIYMQIFSGFHFSLTPSLSSPTLSLSLFLLNPPLLFLSLSLFLSNEMTWLHCSSTQWQPLCCQLVVESPFLCLPSEITSLFVYTTHKWDDPLQGLRSSQQMYYIGRCVYVCVCTIYRIYELYLYSIQKSFLVGCLYVYLPIAVCYVCLCLCV